MDLGDSYKADKARLERTRQDIPDYRESMLYGIHRVWFSPDTPDHVIQAIWDNSDGYGEPGYVPIQGYDWSGIRDSSDSALGAMYEIARRAM